MTMTSTLPAATDFPRLTIAERDRRWAALRGLLDGDGLDALLVFGNGRDPWDQYLTNEAVGSTVFLTRDAEPVAIGGFPLARLDPSGADYERWVTDVRVGDVASVLPGLLGGHGLTRRPVIGVVGLTGLGFGGADGSVRWTTWQRVLAALPRVRFVDASREFELVAMVKSPEEQVLVRKAAAIGEEMCRAWVAATRPGARESEVAAAAFGALIGGGGWIREPVICMRAGRERFSWGRPEWMAMGGGGRVLRPGDSIAAELFACYGGFETQQQIEAHLGEPEPLVRRLEEVCLTAYDAGMALLGRPGLTFGELADAMMEPMLKAGYWNTGPQVHGMGPCWPNTATHVGTQGDPALSGAPALPPVREQDGDVEIAPGMTFAFEPNAIHDNRRVCIGGTVLVTEQGGEELNQLAKRIQVVPV